MPFSPYTGTFSPNLRPTIKTAPDVLVYINGENTVSACSSCRRTFNINNYVTSVSVDLNVDNPPGSATINLSIPIHTVDEFLVDGVPILSPMMEVEIFSKGYFLVEGIPQYYPIFWGLITEVTEDFSGGFYKYTISCSDILKWWDLCVMNINPAFTNPVGTQLGRSIFGNVFFGKNPFDVIWTLAQQSLGDVIVGTNSLVSLYKDAAQASVFRSSLVDMMLYWEDRFTRMRSGLLLYGINGAFVRGDSLWQAYKSGKASFGQPFASTAVAKANGGDAEKQMVYDPTDPSVTAFRTQFMQAGEINFWQSEFETKLKLAQSCKEAIGYEFYMDVDGSIVFKPPFYNLDVIQNKPISWIQEADIITANFTESEAEVITQLQIQGSMYGNVDYGLPEELTPHVSVTDYHLLRKYGWRTQQITSEFLGSPHLMFYHGLDMLDRINAKRFRGSVSIPHRPELRLGFPVYIPHKEQFWYVSGISHSVEIGGRSVTNLTLTARRQKFSAPRGVATLKPAKNASVPPNQSPKQVAKRAWELKMGSAATFPPDPPPPPGVSSPYDTVTLRHPKTGKKLGFPDVIMVHTRPFKPTPETLAQVKGEKPSSGAAQTANKKQKEQKVKVANEEAKKVGQGLTEDEVSDLKARINQNRHSYGLNSSGVYVYAHDKAGAINQFVLINSKQISVTGGGQSAPKLDQSTMIRPVSDSRGFEVIGHFRYGRGVSLRDGSLVLTETEERDKAKISVPVALSGDLFATLTAQSQGLTTVISPYTNPAETLATLTPEENSTAATFSPEGTAQYQNTVGSGGTYVGVAAPKDSPQQKGLPVSVEASQLSKALTLAELTLQQGLGVASTPNGCSCLLSRPSLAFLSTGFSVQPLQNSNPIPQDPDSVTFGDGGLFFSEPVTAAALTVDEVAAKIDGYLFTLYEALDRPYHEFEEAVTGKLVPSTINQAENPLDLFAQPPNPEAFAPPFSSSNRAGLGDPVAIGKQGNIAFSSASAAAKSFGEDLKKAQKKAGLEAEIANLKAAKARNPQNSAEIDAQIASLTLTLNTL